MIFARTAEVVVRTWEDRDRAMFHRLNSDPDVMRFFPFRRDRRQSDEMMDRLNRIFAETGIGFLALQPSDYIDAVGCVGLNHVDASLPFGPAIEIGWRLLPEHWHRGLATMGAKACLEKAFALPISAREIVGVCVAQNAASERVMLRLGLTRGEDFDHPAVDPATHAHLVRHRLYRLGAQDFAAA